MSGALERLSRLSRRVRNLELATEDATRRMENKYHCKGSGSQDDNYLFGYWK